MLCNCSSLNELKLFNFNTNNVTNKEIIFRGCSLLKELNISYMFYNCSSLKVLNISNFKSNDKTNIQKMLKESSFLKTLICTYERMLNEYKN